jgi:hypothetical protein
VENDGQNLGLTFTFTCSGEVSESKAPTLEVRY